MSNVALNTVFANSKSEGLSRLVLLSIADRADSEGRAYCGAKDLCRRTNSERRSVFRALKNLQKIGELKVEPTKGIRGCNRYRITLNQWHTVTSGNESLVASGHLTRDIRSPKPLITPNIYKESNNLESVCSGYSSDEIDKLFKGEPIR